VVVDAPSSGHSVPMLTAPSRVLERAPLGPVAREASRALAILGDHRAFAAVLVTTPEELAITEVLTLHAQVVAAGVATARVVVNAVWPAYVPVADGEWIAESGVSADAAVHWRRHRRQGELIADLESGIGACPRIGFAFAHGELPESDVAALLDTLPGGTA
jgi:anion-transporting  ArsA/GET3 family ATPase